MPPAASAPRPARHRSRPSPRPSYGDGRRTRTPARTAGVTGASPGHDDAHRYHLVHSTASSMPREERTVPFVRKSFFRGETFLDLADAQRRAEAWSATT